MMLGCEFQMLMPLGAGEQHSEGWLSGKTALLLCWCRNAARWEGAIGECQASPLVSIGRRAAAAAAEHLAGVCCSDLELPKVLIVLNRMPPKPRGKKRKLTLFRMRVRCWSRKATGAIKAFRVADLSTRSTLQPGALRKAGHPWADIRRCASHRCTVAYLGSCRISGVSPNRFKVFGSRLCTRGFICLADVLGDDVFRTGCFDSHAVTHHASLSGCVVHNLRWQLDGCAATPAVKPWTRVFMV